MRGGFDETCPLCRPADEEVLWGDAECRVILVADKDYPGYCRVIWRAHVREMTDLVPEAQRRLMRVVLAVETALREVLTPAKINLASLGNQAPHLHWHVIPRFADDPHFPDAIWAKPRRQAPLRTADTALIRARLLTNLKEGS